MDDETGQHFMNQLYGMKRGEAIEMVGSILVNLMLDIPGVPDVSTFTEEDDKHIGDMQCAIWTEVHKQISAYPPLAQILEDGNRINFEGHISESIEVFLGAMCIAILAHNGVLANTSADPFTDSTTEVPEGELIH